MNKLPATAVASLPGRLPQPAMPPTPALNRWRDRIEGWIRVGAKPDATALVPLDEMPQIISELERSCRPAPEQFVQYVAATVVASWPQRESEHIAAFIQAFAQEVEEFPPDVLCSAARHCRQTMKWVPSISEFRQACEVLLAKKRAPVSVLECMRSRHAQLNEERAEAEVERVVDAAHGPGTYKWWQWRLSWTSYMRRITRKQVRQVLLDAAGRHQREAINTELGRCWRLADDDRDTAWSNIVAFADGKFTEPKTPEE